MSRRNRIVITPYAAERPGAQVEGVVATGETFYPGMIVQVDPSVALKNGRHTYKIFDRGADGDQPLGPHVVVIENYLLGKLMTDSYAAGEQFFGYVPLMGDELNLLLLNLSGTADDHTAGEILMVDDGTGKLIATTGTPEMEVAVLLETITDPVADTLAWCRWGAGG
jgi:hypothetical protein